MRTRLNLSLPVEMISRINDLSARRGLSRSAIVEAAVSSFLSPDGPDRMEAAFTRRLDRLSRQTQRLERDLGISTETLALFVRFWLTVTPPLPPDAQGPARIKGNERFEHFIEAVARKLQSGRSILDEISVDVAPKRKSAENSAARDDTGDTASDPTQQAVTGKGDGDHIDL